VSIVPWISRFDPRRSNTRGAGSVTLGAEKLARSDFVALFETFAQGAGVIPEPENVVAPSGLEDAGQGKAGRGRFSGKRRDPPRGEVTLCVRCAAALSGRKIGGGGASR
jgi:hypothetical protein